MKLTCPHCGVTGSIDDKFIGKQLKCPKCNERFTVTEEDAIQTAPPSSPPPVPPKKSNTSNSLPKQQPSQETEEAACTGCGNTFPEDELIELGGRLICATCKPVALQKLKEGAVESGSGGLESGIAGHYTLQAKEVLSEAWEKVKGSKMTIAGAVFAMYCITALLMFIGGAALNMLGLNGQNLTLFIISQLILQLVSGAVSALLYSGLMMMGVRRAVDEPISFSTLFDGFDKAKQIIIVAFLQTIIIMLGFLLLVIPGIYLSIGYLMTYPLIIEKDLSPWEAMEASRKAIHHHWFQVFGLFFVMGLIFMISALPLGIGTFWTMPMGIIMFGIVYRTIFGTKK
ncbi:MAG: hypothetical protein SD837_21215 [Candidatus Electrothrix scaldis]|nr:MAG: hypothetical protein SD837_21215 [Candidatus Electrothrix sp. GW3-3]